MTLTELRALWSNDVLKNRIEQASQIVCYNIVVESAAIPNHTARLSWAVKVLGDPAGWAQVLLRVIIAKNNAVPTPDLILNATDAQVIQAVVDVVDAFALNV